jgi:hypothetical protein
MLWNNLLFLLIALGAMATGILRALRTVARARPPQNLGEPLLAWTEIPRSAIRRDPLGFILVSAKTLVVVSLAVLLLQSVTRPVRWPLPEMYIDLQLRMLSFLVAGGSVAIVFYLSGGLLAISIRALRGRATVTSILPGGICNGMFFLTWDRFNRFQTDPVNRTIWLYSRHSPDICSLVLHPPLTDTAQKAGDLLGRFLSRKDKSGYIPWHRTSMALILCFIPLMGFVPLAGIGLAQIPSPWAWFPQIVLVWGVSLVAGRLVTMFYSFSGLSAAQ